jgi:ATP-dependent DNA helicase DinG
MTITTYGTVTIPSTFNPKLRPIYIHPIASMSRKNINGAYPLVREAVSKVLERHPDDRILVHTVSYDLTRYLQTNLRNNRIVVYGSTEEKQKAIDIYLYTKAAVLLAPSLDRGIDLPEDDCRVIVVAKIPFPSLGDKQISAKLYSKGGQTWYNVKTIRSLVQMTGRGVRSESDYCESYILDKQFLDLIWRRNKHLLPKWWVEALVWNRGEL